MKNKQFNINQIVTIAFISTIFILVLYSLGFFTNLLQIRGTDRKLHDLYQSYVRIIFNSSMWCVVLIVIRKGVVSQITKDNSIIQFVIELLMALGVIVLSVYTLTRMGEFTTLYQGVDIEDVKILYSDYEYNDSIFKIGTVLNSITLIIGIIFITLRTVLTFKKTEGGKA